MTRPHADGNMDAAPHEGSAESIEIRLALARADFDLQVDLRLPAQGITVLFGPSGSGKTSVLRCVAGLERARAARVAVAGEVWQDDEAAVFLPAHRRALGYVFQEASLFSHLDVMGNLRYGLKRSGATHGQQMLEAAIELLGIAHLLKRMTGELSGGERQRVAMARALATGPRLLLLDEPLSAVDQMRRQEVLPWLERLREELRMPMLHVTHSADEVARLADHLVVMEQGRVRASGPVAEVLSAIDEPVVVGADAGALLQGHIIERDAQWHLARAGFPGGQLWLRDAGLAVGQAVRLRVLARDVSVAVQEPQHSSIQNQLPCVIESIAADAHPSQVLLRLRCGESVLVSRITLRALHALGLKAGQQAWAQLKSVAVVQ